MPKLPGFKSYAPLVCLALVAIAWQSLSFYNGKFFPSIISIANAFVTLSEPIPGYGVGGSVTQAVETTFLTYFLGLALSIPVGITLGVLLGYFKTVGKWFDPYVLMIYSVPRIVLIPVIVIFFGLGINAKVFVVFLASVFDVLMPTTQGIRNVSETLLETGRSLKLSKPQIIRKIVLPGSLPFIMSGIRLGMGHGFVGVIVAEWYLSSAGMGGELREFSNELAMGNVMVFVIVTAVLGIAITEIAKLVERHFSRWKAW